MTPARPTVDVDGLTEEVRASIREKAVDRFLSDYLAADARDWVSGFAARAALDVIAAHLAAVTAERDEARAAVESLSSRWRANRDMLRRRAEGNRTADRMDRREANTWDVAAEQLTAALDHVPTTEGGEG